jgi:hypothetical protein
MIETDQFVPYVNCRDLVPALRFQPWNPDAIRSLAAPGFVFTLSPHGFVQLNLERIKIDDAASYVRQPDDERIVRSALGRLNQLFACEPCQVVEAFADYISESEHYADMRPPSAVSEDGRSLFLIPRYRQVCIETAAQEHVVHLETITLAKEQKVPTATAVGQMLISGRELWKRWKSTLLNSLSSYSRNWSIAGFPIFASAVQASSS